MSTRLDAEKTGGLLRQIVRYPGNIVVVAGGGKGKTELAERLVSASSVGCSIPSSYPIACILGALRTWSSPAILLNMVAQGLITEKEMQTFARQVMTHCGISSSSDVISRIAFSDPAAVRSVYSAARMVGYGMAPASVGTRFMPLYYLIDEQGTTHYDCPIGDPGQDLFIAWSENSSPMEFRGALKFSDAKGKTIPWQFADPALPAGKKQIKAAIKALASVGGLDTGVFSSAANSAETGVLLISNDQRHSVYIGPWGVAFTADGLSAGGKSASVDDVRLALEAALNVGATRKSVSTLKSGAPQGSGGESDFVPMFDTLVKENPVLALHIIISSACAADILSASANNSSSIGGAVRHLLVTAGISDGPVLIETETKARGVYSLTAHNSSIEEDLTQLRLDFGPRRVEVTVSSSLLEACLGSMVLSRPVHFSALDMTAVRNIAVKTTTQKGGLDSGLLNVMQFISNCATEASVVVVTETRDDFNSNSDDDEEAVDRSRTTLGANSRFAIHITGSGDKRNLWLRGRGYGVFEDFTVVSNGVELIHYPDNLIKANTSPIDLVATAGM